MRSHAWMRWRQARYPAAAEAGLSKRGPQTCIRMIMSGAVSSGGPEAALRMRTSAAPARRAVKLGTRPMALKWNSDAREKPRTCSQATWLGGGVVGLTLYSDSGSAAGPNHM